ncbi:hypothetical protein ACXJJ3_42110 (plasmid) [Kribbella sp. WER1]
MRRPGWLLPRRSAAERRLAKAERALKRTRKGMRKHAHCTPRGEVLAYREYLQLGQVRRAREAVTDELINGN